LNSLMTGPRSGTAPVVFAAALLLALPAAAFDYVADEKGTFWGIQSSASPHVDTGSIRATQVGAGLGQALSTTINGFGGIKVKVLQQSPARGGLEQPVSRFNGELMRGFGLVFDGVDRFESTQSIELAIWEPIQVDLAPSIAPSSVLASGRGTCG
jgi:amidase